MAYTQVYSTAGYTKPLIFQLAAVIQRDISAALAAVNSSPPCPYLPFAEYHFAEVWPKSEPALIIVPVTDRFDNNSVGSRKQLVDIQLTVVVSNQDPEVLAIMVQDYVHAVDDIIIGLGEQENVNNTPNFGDFYTTHPLNVPFAGTNPTPVIAATTAALGTGCVMSCLTTAHTYRSLVTRGRGFALTATIDMQVQLEEK
jgi:hypothetical protein